MARKITKRQQQIYDFIKEYQQEKGYPPSVREMASAVGLSSPSTVHAHLSALEARGLLKRDATKPRALELFNEDGSSVSISKSDEPTAPRGTVVSLPELRSWPSRISKTLLLSRPKSPLIRVPLSLRYMGAQ